MWPYPWTHVGTPSHLGHMDRVAATMPSQAHAGAAQEAPDIGQWEGQDVPLVRPSSCNVKGGIPSSRRYLPTYLSRLLRFGLNTAYSAKLRVGICRGRNGRIMDESRQKRSDDTKIRQMTARIFLKQHTWAESNCASEAHFYKNYSHL